MVDPSPTGICPKRSMLRYNRSKNSIALNKLTLQVNGELYPLPNDTSTPARFCYSPQTCYCRELIIGMLGLVVSSLSNSGFTIYLQRTDGSVIDGFKYNPLDWDSFKCEGGWSLERETIQLSFSI